MTLNMFDLFLRQKDFCLYQVLWRPYTKWDRAHKIVQQLHQVSNDFMLIFVCDLKMPWKVVNCRGSISSTIIKPQYSNSQLTCRWKSFQVLQNYSPHSSPIFFFFLNVSEVIPDVHAHYPTCSPSRPHQPNNDTSKRRSSFNYLYPNRNRSRLTCINPSNPSTLPCSSVRKQCIYHTP